MPVESRVGPVVDVPVRKKKPVPVPDSVRESVKAHWEDPNFPGSFSSASTFLKEYIKAGYTEPRLHLQDVMRILGSIPVYSMSLRRRKRFAQRHVDYSTGGINRNWHIDLAYMPEDRGYRYIAVMVDLQDAYLICFPLKTKTAKEFQDGFEKVCRDYKLNGVIESIGTDGGGEFTGNRAYFKSKNIRFIIKAGRSKAFLAEESVQRIKTRLLRLLRQKLSTDWVRWLPSCVAALNHTVSKGLLFMASPADVHDPAFDPYVKALRSLARHAPSPPVEKRQYKPGDTVFLDYPPSPLHKGYDVARGVTYVVKQADTSRRPTLYTLTEIDGTVLHGKSLVKIPTEIIFNCTRIQRVHVAGKYYAHEIHPAPGVEEQDHPIHKILARRTNKKTGEKEALVSFLFWPEKYKTWVPLKDIVSGETGDDK